MSTPYAWLISRQYPHLLYLRMLPGRGFGQRVVPNTARCEVALFIDGLFGSSMAATKAARVYPR